LDLSGGGFGKAEILSIFLPIICPSILPCLPDLSHGSGDVNQASLPFIHQNQDC
jgi:hypothetical protein